MTVATKPRTYTCARCGKKQTADRMVFSQWTKSRYCPDIDQCTTRRDTLMARLEAKIDRDAESGCWNWTAALSVNGYGQVMIEHHKTPAHRAMYGLLIGPIPDGLTLDHLCRNRACVNPAHLEPVTLRENILRGTAPSAVNARKTHCVNGHPFDAANTVSDRLGNRVCKECRRESRRQSTRRWRAKVAA